jgi:glycyl-radical enzyme activating protein family protein
MTMGLIGSIQDYSTKDGPGLRSTVFMKGCTLACKWCANPELISFDDQEVYFFSERITDPDMAVRENEGALARQDGRWRLDRSRLPEPDELIERNTQMIFETVARRMSVDECVAKLLRNREFYTASDGGVTFSGGEAMIQVAFVSECLKRLKDNGVHTTVDTAGNVPWAYFTKVLDHTDLFLYDIKSCDERLHRQGTGAGSKRILDNARRLAEADRPMWVRLVVIPGWNDVATDLEERLRFTASLGDAVKRVDLLAYHSLGVGKYLRLGLDYPLPGMPRLDERLIEEAMALGTDLGLNMHYEPGVHA